MKLTFIILISFIFSLNIQASHIVGGDIYYDYLGNNNYKITLLLYRDCASTGAAYDDPLSLGVFDVGGNLVKELLIPFPGSVVLPVILDNPCISTPSGICTEKAIYETNVNLPPTYAGYTVAYQRCCRGPHILNLNTPDETGLTLSTHITGTNLNAIQNSSPRFLNYPPLVICNNDILNFNHSATDPDGDILSYELITPNAGANSLSPMPSPPPSPPYFPVNWSAGFSAQNPLGPGASISINPVTGKLTADPDLLGLFVVGIRVKEFRNGVLIGQSDRDFLFKVVNCIIQMQAKITPQIESSNFISFCEGYDAKFQNGSFGGTSYSWDFGVEGIDTDVSTEFSPTYTYPGPGVYNVRLVVNPGWPCTDTSVQTFILNENINLSFAVKDSICITNNSFDFIGSYVGPPNPLFSWDFGSHASMQNANTLSVNDVVFDTPGTIPISLKVETEFCTETVTDNVFIYNEPQINFGVDSELKCVPYLAQFYDSSISYSPLIYSWDFGDGTFSNLKNPTHLYENAGTYDVSLSIQSTEGCIATLSLTKGSLIMVYPSPTSKFTSTPAITDVFKPFFKLSDQSFDSNYLKYIYNDSLFTEERNPTISFIESGRHRIYQIVKNEYGCIDTSFLIVEIIPQTTIYIPNTFTPDGNKFNNIFLPIVYDILNYEFSIFNRWGEEIFHTTDRKEGWDGTYKGEACQEGVYTYLIKITNNANKIISKTGQINLLR